MGFRKLTSFILSQNLVKTYNNLNEYVISKNKKYIVIGIDVWLYAYKYKYLYNNIIFGFYKLLTTMLLNNILPIMIFDGKTPLEKMNIVNKRNNKKNNINKRIINLSNLNPTDEINNKINQLSKQLIYITREDINSLKELLLLLNIQFIDAIEEADTVCCQLFKENKIDACLSDDTDILVYGCIIIKIMGEQIIEYDINHILKMLNINMNQFVDMCILLGCDYIQLYPKLEPEQCYDLIKNNTLENIISTCKYNKKNKIFLKNYIQIKKKFISYAIQNINDIILENNLFIDINKLSSLLHNNKVYLNLYKFKNDINNINNIINNKIFIKS
jgi:5'-3' exonuclease